MIRVYQFIMFVLENVDLDQLTSETYGKWQLKCHNTPLIWMNLCHGNHYQKFSEA